MFLFHLFSNLDDVQVGSGRTEFSRREIRPARSTIQVDALSHLSSQQPRQNLDFEMKKNEGRTLTGQGPREAGEAA